MKANDALIEAFKEKGLDATTEQIEAALNLCSAEQKKALNIRFGLEGEHTKTYFEVSKEMNLTIERVRQILSQAFRSLKKNLRPAC